jgi:hypothetical protein
MPHSNLTTATAELTAPTAVGSGDWLGHWIPETNMKNITRKLAAILDSWPDWIKALIVVQLVTTFFFGYGWVTKLIKWVWSQVA